MQQKTGTIFIEEKIASKIFVKKELGTEIISYKEEEMIPLTDKENKFYEDQKNFIYAKKSFVQMNLNTRK